MILQILITSIVLLFLYFFRTWYLIPKRTIERYVKSIKDKGYKVKSFPFHPLNNHFEYILDKPSKDGDFFRVFRDEYPQYDVIVSNIVNTPIIQFCHPDFIKDYYSVDKHYSFPKQKSIILQVARIAGSGLALSEGEQWKRKRKIFNAIFNFDFVKSQTKRITQICDQCIDRMEKQTKLYSQNGQKFVYYNILELTIQIFSKIVLISFLGLDTDEKIQNIEVANYLKQLIDDSCQDLDTMGMIFGLKFLESGLRQRDRKINVKLHLYQEWALKYIRKKIKSSQYNFDENKQPSDIIEALINYQKKEATKQGQSMISEHQIMEEFNTFFFAGTDTTSNYTQMMIYFVALNPRVEAKLRQQISRYMKQDDYSFENLKNFKYIDNIQKETTRMYGPATFLFIRVAKDDNYLNGIPIKKGTLVSIMQQGNHFSEQYFKDPLQFRPERWDSECDSIPPFALGGFSAGARTCIGKHLALLQNKIAMIKFMRRYKKIILPKTNFKMHCRFLPFPEEFKTKLVIDQ